MELVIIRPPLVFGPGVKANFRRLIWLADLGLPLPFLSIRSRRDLIGLSNLADFIETCMVHPDAAGKVWLVADAESVSTPELLRRISMHLNRPVKLFGVSPELMRRVAGLLHSRHAIDRLCDSLLVDSTPARACLGWLPKTSMDDELARTVAAYLSQRKR
jgi:UDP-glucose 4-epimerase